MMAGRISPLANPAFRTLFAAQICSLVAIGLMTVGMSLAAYRIGGAALAGQILGFLLAVKMVAYVGIAPLAEAVFAGRSRKRVMVGLDLARSAMLLPMAFAVTTWQVAGLALLFFAVSASFTPLFQSVIPDLLTDEETYGRALVWSRMASTLESVLSPVLAAIALLFVTGEYLFWLAALAFAGSVLALMRTRFPQYTRPGVSAPFKDRALRGLTIYRRTPRLRALFTVNLALAFSMAWVLVNSVVVASVRLGDAELFLPVLMAAYGVGAVHPAAAWNMGLFPSLGGVRGGGLIGADTGRADDRKVRQWCRPARAVRSAVFPVPRGLACGLSSGRFSGCTDRAGTCADFSFPDDAWLCGAGGAYLARDRSLVSRT